jgi:hypothetical protein
MQGLPPPYLPFIHFALLKFSADVAAFVTDNGFDLCAKTDQRFMESVFKLLITQFGYKPQLTIQ